MGIPQLFYYHKMSYSLVVILELNSVSEIQYNDNK